MSTPRLYPRLAAGLEFPVPAALNTYSVCESSSSARANARVVKAMSRTERAFDGRLSIEDIDADWAVQRERVRARWLA